MVNYKVKVNLGNYHKDDEFHNVRKTIQGNDEINVIAFELGYHPPIYTDVKFKICNPFIGYSSEYNFKRKPVDFLEKVLELDYIENLEITKEEK